MAVAINCTQTPGVGVGGIGVRVGVSVGMGVKVGIGASVGTGVEVGPRGMAVIRGSVDRTTPAEGVGSTREGRTKGTISAAARTQTSITSTPPMARAHPGKRAFREGAGGTLRGWPQ